MWNSITYNKGLFVAIGHRGAYNYNYDRRHLVDGGILVSSDTNKWTNTCPKNFAPSAIAWDGKSHI